MNERILFVDRDGTILEEPEDFQVDRFEKMRFVEGVLPALKRLREAGWKLVMVSNQDGLGTKSFPRADFTGPHELMMQILESQGARFDEVLICPHMPGEGCECRKPGTGLVKKYLKDGVLDVANCYVIGDRETDMKLADNMGLRGLRVGPDGRSWAEIADEIENAAKSARHARVERNTKETRIVVEAWLDRSGKNEINTGVGFFDHMLTQIAVHGGIRLHVRAVGDLEIDDHHTIEDVGPCARRGAQGGARRQARHPPLRLPAADGRDARALRARHLWQAVPNLQGEVQAPQGGRHVHRDGRALLPLARPDDGRDAQPQGAGQERPPRGRGTLQGVRAHAARRCEN